MIVDIRTMLVILAATSLLMALMLWMVFPGQSRDGLSKWALGLVLQAGAWALFASRGMVHDVFSVVAGNLLFSLGVALKAGSLLEFQHREAPDWLLWALPGVIATSFLLLLDSAHALALLNGLAYALAYAGMAWLMWRPPHTTSWRVRWLMIAAFVMSASGFLLRGVIAQFLPEALADPLESSPLQTVSYLLGHALVVMSSTGILLMHKERIDEHTRELATTDPLTGVYNRRTFIDLADMALARAQRTSTPLSLLMLDLDHFKNVNDRHGHLVGDQVLKSFVRLVETCLRREDLLVRFGGEEFCVLLPDATLEGAMALAERARTLVEQTPLFVQGAAVNLTVSFGVDTVRVGEPGTVELLLQRADEALYRAKKAGRNRVASYVE